MAKKIVKEAQIHYCDNQTDNLIAISKRNYEGQKRDIMVAIEKNEDKLKIITETSEMTRAYSGYESADFGKEFA